jgi:hypothetical protein
VGKYGAAREATDDNILRRMRMAWWITKAANTPLEFVILTTFGRQQWLNEVASVVMLYVQSIACLVKAAGEYCEIICVRV